MVVRVVKRRKCPLIMMMGGWVWVVEGRRSKLLQEVIYILQNYTPLFIGLNWFLVNENLFEPIERGEKSCKILARSFGSYWYSLEEREMEEVSSLFVLCSGFYSLVLSNSVVLKAAAWQMTLKMQMACDIPLRKLVVWTTFFLPERQGWPSAWSKKKLGSIKH